MRIRIRLGELGVRRLRSGLLAAVCMAGTAIYLAVLGRHYPVETWLSWRLGLLYAWVALFCVGSVGGGSVVVERLLPGVRLPRLEALVLSMAVGVVVFVLAMYLGGALAWFGPLFAVLLSLTMALSGVGSLRRLLAEPDAGARTAPSFVGTVVSIAGLLGVFLVYFGVLTPDAINYDATWSHLTVAQDYAREGRLVAFPGDYNKQVPHLASIVYSWAFMVPGLDVMGRWMLAQHLEFALFLWTLAGVGAAVHWVVQARVRGIWAAFFLFPSIFVYDHNLGAAADHVLAFFGPPVLLAARHFFPRLALRKAVLLGVVLGGAALTKYQAMYFVVPMGLLVLLRTTWLVITDIRRTKIDGRRLLGPLLLGATLLLVMSPHFLKNTVFHGNPVYPFMQQVFSTSHPVSPGSVVDFQNIYLDQNWVPKGTFSEKLWSTVQVFFTFSFLPHYNFYGGLPMFGSLFTLLLPCLFFLRKNVRLVFTVLLASGGLSMWASTFLVDRNLQIILPLLAVATASMIVEVWRFGGAARVGLVPLVALQVIWGGDQAFYSGSPRFHDSIAIIRSGFDKKAATRFDRYLRPYRDVGAALPKGAKVLMHSTHQSLGIDREVVLDWLGFQALVHYGHVRTVHDLVAYYRKLGITHLVYMHHERVASTKQEEVLWQALALRMSSKTKQIGQLRLFELPKELPPQTAPYRVLCLGLDGYADGVYDIADLATNEYLVPELRSFRPPRIAVPDAQQARTHLRAVDAVVVGPRGNYESQLQVDLRPLASTIKFVGAYGVYLRRP